MRACIHAWMHARMQHASMQAYQHYAPKACTYVCMQFLNVDTRRHAQVLSALAPEFTPTPSAIAFVCFNMFEGIGICSQHTESLLIHHPDESFRCFWILNFVVLHFVFFSESIGINLHTCVFQNPLSQNSESNIVHNGQTSRVPQISGLQICYETKLRPLPNLVLLISIVFSIVLKGLVYNFPTR